MTEEKSQLFVEEDEDMQDSGSEQSDSQFHEAYEQPEDDDPIIKSIPIVMNTLPSRSTQSLHIIQYPGRPHTRTLDNDSFKASIKEDSNYLEVKLPLDTSKFFNGQKSEDWGDQITEQGLQGVLNKTEGGLYIAQVVRKEDGDVKLVLVPIDSTAQLRPSFKYLDDLDNLTQTQRRAEANDGTKNNQIQILQTSSKSGSQITNSEGFGNALGESLRHIKKFDEEEWCNLNWKSSNATSSETIKSHISGTADDITLTTTTTMDQYINDLTN
jgi:DNA-directed RNA polymerase-3 subunit RPC5